VKGAELTISPFIIAPLRGDPICELLEGIGSELKHINEVGFAGDEKSFVLR
jgi:hypothetical protein